MKVQNFTNQKLTIWSKGWQLGFMRTIFFIGKTEMANQCFLALIKYNLPFSFKPFQGHRKLLHTSSALFTVQSGKVKQTRNRSNPVTYEDSLSPPHIGHRKSWNSWNTSTIDGGLRPSETLIEDMFIRKFMEGTFPGVLLSKVIIKRQYNIIRIAALIKCSVSPQTVCFMIGYTETLLGYWLHCNVKLEFQTVPDIKKTIFKCV